ncbi:hypothetical protein ACIU1J_05415 [Azospirillum doebereinerae]|nr:hypothetical protein [Azospirillum doebereinerae]MCG5240855.1 hypothetical protein [Azospirillum doebereinerae]
MTAPSDQLQREKLALVLALRRFPPADRARIIADMLADLGQLSSSTPPAS